MRLPFHEQLDRARTVLIAGCGGGFDVFAGLPLYFALERAGKDVHLANLTFATIPTDSGRRPVPELVAIDADSPGDDDYFPEKYLSAFFASRGERVEVWAIERLGPAAVSRAYSALARELRADTIVLVDGGTDSLMRGDEPGLGTPVEDIASICAVDALDVERKLLVCIGFGIDAYHGVSHFHVLEAISELAQAGGYLGAFSLTADMQESRDLHEAATFALERCVLPSIVLTSILAAIDGRFGDHHATRRTRSSELFINPLMSLYWCFDLRSVASRILYREQIRDIETFHDTVFAIQRFRAALTTVKPSRAIPL